MEFFDNQTLQHNGKNVSGKKDQPIILENNKNIENQSNQ